MIELMGDCDSNDNLNGNQCNGLYDLFKDEMSELGESSLDWWHEEVDKSSQNGLSSRDGGSQSPVFKTPQLSLKNRRCRKGFIGSQSTSGLKRFRESSPAESLEFYSPFKCSRLSPIIPTTTDRNGRVPVDLEGLLEVGNENLWNSAFDTPTTSNILRSKLNLEEEKLLVPASLTGESNTVPASLEGLLHDGSETSWNSAFATPITSKSTNSRLNSEERQLLLPAPMTCEMGTVPSSLEPLLQDGSEMSWSSAFATPLVSNGTLSRLNSEERKILMPTSTSKNLHILFDSESVSEEKNCNFSANINEDQSSKESSILFEKTTIMLDKNDSESSANSILCYSTPNLNRTYIVNVPRNLSKTLSALEDDGNKLEEEIVKINAKESSLLRNDSSSNGENKGRLTITKPRRRSTLSSSDSGMNDFTTNSVEVDCTLLTSGGSTVSRKLFNGEGLDEGAPSVPLEDSGAGESRETSNTKLCTSLNLCVSFQSSPSPISHRSTEMQLPVAQNSITNEEFANNLSFNTLEEVCQITELMAESLNSQIECAEDVKTPHIPIISISNGCRLARTSTPIVRIDKYSKLESEIKKKRLKFVHVPNNEMPTVYNEDDKTNKLEIVRIAPQKCVDGHQSNNVSNMENVSLVKHVENKNITDCSRFQAIKSIVNCTRKFAYVPSSLNHNIIVNKKENTKILLEDIVESANTLEFMAQRKINHDKGGKLVQLPNSLNQKTGFVPFCELKNLTYPEDDKDAEQDHCNPQMVSFNCSENVSLNVDTNIYSNLSKSNNTLTDISRISNNLNSSDLFSLNESVIEPKNTHSEIVGNSVFEFVKPSKIDKVKTYLNDITGGKQEFVNDSKSTISREVGDSFNSVDLNKDTDKDICKDNILGVKYKSITCQNNNNKTVEISEQFKKESIGDALQSKNDNFSLIGEKTVHDNMMTDTQMIFVVEHAELTHQLTEDVNVFTQWSKENGNVESNTDNETSTVDLNIDTAKCDSVKNVMNDEQNVLIDKKICCTNNETAVIDHCSIVENNQKKEEIERILPENLQKEFSECMEDNFVWSKPDFKTQIKENMVVKASFKHEEDLGDILNSTVIKHLFNEGQEKDFQDEEKLVEERMSFTQNLLNFDESGITVRNVSHESNVGEKELKVNVSITKCLKNEKENVPCVDKITSSSNVVSPLDLASSKANNVTENEIEREPLKIKDTNEKNSYFQDNIMKNKRYSNTNKNVTANSVMMKDTSIEIKFHQPKENKQLQINKPLVMQEFESKISENAKYHVLEESSFKKPSLLNEENKINISNNLCSQFEECTTHENTTIPDTSIMLSDIRSMFSDENDIETDHHDLKGSEKQIEMINGSTNDVQNRSLSLVLDSDERILLDKKSNYDINDECVLKVWKNHKAEFRTPESNGLQKKALSVSLDKADYPIHSKTSDNKKLYPDSEKLKTSFTTVGGKPISVSVEALNKARNIYSEVESEIESLEDKVILPVKMTKADSSGLNAICKRGITLNSDEVSNICVSDLLKDVDKEDSSYKQNIFNTKTGVSKFQGFSTASGRKVYVSEKALDSARRVFSAELNESTHLDNNENNSEVEIAKLQKGQSENSYKITDSEGAFHRDTIGSEIYEDIEFPLVLKEGFVSTGKRQNLVTEDAIKSAHVECPNSSNSNTILDERVSSRSSMSKTFDLLKNHSVSLQSNETTDDICFLPKEAEIADDHKKIIVSKEALIHTKNVFSENGFKYENISECLKASKPKFQGFLTAGGKKVSISDEALTRAKHMFSDEASDIKLPNDSARSANISMPFEMKVVEHVKLSGNINSHGITPADLKNDGFSNGKDVANDSISEDALRKATGMFSKKAIEVDLINKPTVQSASSISTNFQGFSTASGKNVSVSDDALMKAKGLFSEEAIEVDFVNNPIVQSANKSVSSVSTNFQGFSTASGKNVSVSDDALMKAKGLFSEEAIEVDFVNKPTIQSANKSVSSVSTNFQGFSTASGKNVSVSDDALMKAKGLFSEEAIEVDFVNKPTIQSANKSVSSVSTNFQGYSTASGKNVTVSEDALRKAKGLFLEETIEVDLVNKPTIQSANKSASVSTIFQGFSTASGKNVTVSEDALRKAKGLFSEDAIEMDLLNKPTIQSANKSVSSVSTNFQGFSTANGKYVSVSDDALSKAKGLFSEEAIEMDLLNKPTIQPANKSMSSFSSNFQGFSTASGKNVTVSEDALRKAKGLFSEDAIEMDLLNKPTAQSVNKSASSVSSNFQEFSTASGKNVSVSEDALRKAKGLFSEDGIEMDLLNKPTIQSANKSVSSVSTNFQGFSTANGKYVSVSDDALSKAKGLFSEEAIEMDLLNKPTIKSANKSTSSVSTNFQGFSTASGKYVSVSDDALSKAKDLFSEEAIEMDLLNKPTAQSANKSASSVSTKFQGFSTASGKNVSVSEDALRKAKGLFSEEAIEVDLVNKPTIQSTNKSVSTKFQGFSTASGKNVSVSDDALKKAKSLFMEDSFEMGLDKSSTTSAVDTSRTNPSKCKGLTTTNGKDVSVSEHTLKNLNDVFAENIFDFKLSKEVKTPSSFKGFASASGKEIMVSEEALKNVRDLFSNDLELENWDKVSPSKTEAKTLKKKNQEYVLRSGDSKRVPNEYLLKLNSYSEQYSNHKQPSSIKKLNTTLSKFNGFATANGKEVPVSASALDKARSFLADDMDNVLVELCNIDESLLANVSTTEYKKSEKVSKGIKSLSADIKYKDEAVCNESNLKPSPVLKSSCSAKRTNASKNRLRRGRLSQSSKRNEINIEKSPAKAQHLNHIVHNEDKNSCTPGHRPTVLSVKRNINFNVLDTDVNEVFVKPQSDIIRTPVAKMSLSLTQEVNESAAALLADEDSFDSSTWGYISCPDMMNDRTSAPTALISSEENVSQIVRNKSLGSPVLSRSDRCKRKRKNKFSQSSSPGRSTQCSQKSTTSSFTVPYKSVTESDSTSAQTIKKLARHLDYSTPFGKRLKTSDSHRMVGKCHENCKYNCVLGKKDICAEVAAGRQAAAAAQDTVIKKKISAGAGPRSCKGSYYICKQEKHLQRKWRDVVDGENPCSYTRTELITFGLKEDIFNITAENAAEFRFSAWNYYSTSVCQENISGLLVGDGAQLVLDSKGTAGVEEVTRAFLSSPGVEPSLVPAGWVANHYRWLVWKLAATERSFPHQFAARCLTPNMLLLQLKYRYDREIDDCQRPAIRKILECDDSAAKRLVLCVAKIIKLDNTDGDPRYELELTDGWYGITATVDHEMSQRVHTHIIEVGIKLIMHGAELINCDQGCSPLEVGPDVRLKLYSNSTRRARWDAKLGYCTCPGPLQISLTSVLPTGGLISCVSITIVRVYPLLYVEKLEEGKSIFRSARVEEQVAARWERQRQACVEDVYSQIRKEMSQEDADSVRTKSRGFPTAHDLALICSGEKLAQILESAPDPESVESLLNEEQKIAVTEYRRMKNEKLQQELQSRVQDKLKETSNASRNVLPLLKVRCVDPGISMSVKSAILSVWRPSEDVSRLLSEGSTIKAFSLQTAGLRSGDLQLSAGRHTAYQPIQNSKTKYHRRKVTDLSDINSDFQPPFGELDVVGMVVHIGPPPKGSSGFQTVYLADSFTNIIGVAFWGGVKQFGWEEMLKPKTLVSASNLQWRHGAAIRWVPCAYASELSIFSAHPRQLHLQKGLASLSQQIEQQGLEDVYSTCENKVSMLLSGATSPLPVLISGKNVGSRLSDSLHNGINGLGLRTPPNSRGRNNVQRTVLSNVNLPALSGPIEELNISCSTHIEFGDSPLDRRLYKLRQYGDAPSLSTEMYIPVLPSVRKEFHVPKKRISPATSPPLSLDSDPD